MQGSKPPFEGCEMLWSCQMIFWWMVLSFITLNCNGLHDLAKWSNTFSGILCLGGNVIALQEMHLTEDQFFSFRLGTSKYE